MANPKGHEASLVKFKPKWRHGQTTVIRVPVLLAEQILDYAHQLDQGQSIALLQVDREVLEREAKRLCKKKTLPKNWQEFINFVLSAPRKGQVGDEEPSS